MGNCSIHGKHSGKTCGYCGLGNRIKDMSVHAENVQLKNKLDALRPYLKHTPECLMVESHDYSPCTCGLTAALNGDDDE